MPTYLEIDPQTNSVTITREPQLQRQQVIVPGNISSAAIVPGSELLIENETKRSP